MATTRKRRAAARTLRAPARPFDALTYAQATFKSAHNAYDRHERPVSRQYRLLGNAGEHWQGRCRGLELDLNLSSHNWLWSVNHLGGYQGAVDQQLSVYLADFVEWHAANPDHDVVTVTLDLKDAEPLDAHPESTAVSEFADRLDAALSAAFGGIASFFTAAELQGAKPNLLAGAASWPTLGALRGKFIWCLSGCESLKRQYLRASGPRICFADRSIDQGDTFDPASSPDRVFYNFNLDAWLMERNKPGWHRILREIARDGRCITRGYVVNNEGVWRDAVSAGLSILATDKVAAYRWASVGPEPFAQRVSGP